MQPATLLSLAAEVHLSLLCLRKYTGHEPTIAAVWHHLVKLWCSKARFFSHPFHRFVPLPLDAMDRAPLALMCSAVHTQTARLCIFSDASHSLSMADAQVWHGNVVQTLS